MFKRIAVYLGAFFLPPLFLGIYLAATSLTTAMVIRNPEPLPGELPSAWIPPSKKPVAVIIASNAGSQITDLMGPYEILQASGLFRVIVAAPVRQLSPLTTALTILPDMELSQVPDPDLIFVPAIVDPTQAAIVDWVRERAPRAKLVVGACEGARVLANAGLLAGKHATSHSMALKELKKAFKNTTWGDTARVVTDGNVMTSQGITGAIDAALAAVEKFAVTKTPESVGLADELGWKPELGADWRPGPLAPLDFAQIAIDSIFATFDSGRRWVGVLTYPGVSELSLALTLDSLPRTMHSRAFSVAAVRTLIRTRYGLLIVPTASVSQASVPDLLIVPSGLTPQGAFPAVDPLSDPLIDAWVRSRNLIVKSWLNHPSGETLNRSLDLMTQLDGVRAARATARLMEYPWEPALAGPTAGHRFRLGAVAIFYALIGGLGVFLARWIEKRKHRSSQRLARSE